MSRKNISISTPIEKAAMEIMRARKIVGLSALIDILIREEYERRQAPVIYPMPEPRPTGYVGFNETAQVKKTNSAPGVDDAKTGVEMLGKIAVADIVSAGGGAKTASGEAILPDDTQTQSGPPPKVRK